MNTNNLPPRLKLLFEEMKEEDKRMVLAAWERHERACRKTLVGTDPMFLEELLTEIRLGRYGRWIGDTASQIDFAREGFGVEVY